MHEARERERWNHTGAVLCLLANLHRDPKKHRPFRPEDFHPCAEKHSGAVEDTGMAFRLMKEAFVKTNRPET